MQMIVKMWFCAASKYTLTGNVAIAVNAPSRIWNVQHGLSQEGPKT